MSDSGRSGRNLFDRSLDLLRDVSDRVQREASRSWQMSGLKADLASLRRQRAEALRRLGMEAHRRLTAPGGIDCGLSGLQAQAKEIDELTARIMSGEAEIVRLETAAIRRPETAGDKPQKDSRRFTTSEHRAGIALAEPPVSVDPLEDILGKAADVEMVEIEEAH